MFITDEIPFPNEPGLAKFIRLNESGEASASLYGTLGIPLIPPGVEVSNGGTSSSVCYVAGFVSPPFVVIIWIHLGGEIHRGGHRHGCVMFFKIADG